MNGTWHNEFQWRTAQNRLDILPSINPLGIRGLFVEGIFPSMLVATLPDEPERIDETVGLLTMCMGGGMGMAMILERC